MLLIFRIDNYHIDIPKYKFYILSVPLRKSTVKRFHGDFFEFWETFGVGITYQKL